MLQMPKAIEAPANHQFTNSRNTPKAFKLQRHTTNITYFGLPWAYPIPTIALALLGLGNGPGSK